MTALRYALVVITHGQAPTLRQSVQSFYEHVDPKPTLTSTFIDGPRVDLPQQLETGKGAPARVLWSEKQRGFCTNTRLAWESISRNRAIDYVFWLEHDFVFTRRVNLEDLAVVLGLNLGLAQMQFMRGPVNDQENAAGGLFESRPGQYDERTTSVLGADGRTAFGGKWLEQRAYMTTNPCLMRREFMASYPWPATYGQECEGKFGIDLVNAGRSFGVWGRGEPWVEHVGVRDGFGY